MMQLTFTTYDIAERIITSYELYKKGFKSWQDHLNFCSDIRMLVGEDFYNETCKYAEEAVKCQKRLAGKQLPTEIKQSPHGQNKPQNTKRL